MITHKNVYVKYIYTYIHYTYMPTFKHLSHKYGSYELNSKQSGYVFDRKTILLENLNTLL